MEKIKLITEAYSTQPRAWQVVDKYSRYFLPEHCVEIKLEKIGFDTNENLYEEGLYYVGYDLEGQKLFQFLRDSVNVEFDTEVKND